MVEPSKRRMGHLEQEAMEVWWRPHIHETLTPQRAMAFTHASRRVEPGKKCLRRTTGSGGNDGERGESISTLPAKTLRQRISWWEFDHGSGNGEFATLKNLSAASICLVYFAASCGSANGPTAPVSQTTVHAVRRPRSSSAGTNHCLGVAAPGRSGGRKARGRS